MFSNENKLKILEQKLLDLESKKYQAELNVMVFTDLEEPTSNIEKLKAHVVMLGTAIKTLEEEKQSLEV